MNYCHASGRPSRRKFLRRTLSLSAALGIQHTLPAWSQSAPLHDLSGLSGKTFKLDVSHVQGELDGKTSKFVLVNGQLPAPLLRWQEGDDVTIDVRNRLQSDTSIHWHGLLLPYQMDGVPGVTFPGIKPGEIFKYQFPINQAGTYWYHSHSGLQEQLGHYGPIIISPKGKDPVAYDREYVMLLSDWTFENPHTVFSKLKKMSDTYNFQQRTVFDFFNDVQAEGLSRTLAQRLMWGSMRMNPTDIADVTSATYTYLINGHSPAENWTGLFKPGERVRLRIINASAMSIFNVRIPGLPMLVVQADGLDVQPVTIDEFQIGTAETYDVVIQPNDNRSYDFIAESNDRSGLGVATLSASARLPSQTRSDIPEPRKRPLLTMKDMAMAHGDHALGHDGDHSLHKRSKAKYKAEDMHSDSVQGHASPHVAGRSTDDTSAVKQNHPHKVGVGVMGLAEKPSSRLHERPLGLQDVPHRVLVYADLKSLRHNPDTRPPERELELHLTSNMERYMWSFDGLKFSEVDEPIKFYKGERLRLVLVNDTMMPHPIHLHGMFFEVVTDSHHYKPRKHTIVVKPGEKLAVDITADAVGDWAFHCHLLYHMLAGMMRIVSVLDEPRDG
jgi:CopA family copper-resistance protein